MNRALVALRYGALERFDLIATYNRAMLFDFF